MNEQTRQLAAQLPPETWYCDPDVAPPTATGQAWLIWKWDGVKANYPGFVAEVESYEAASFIVAAHNALVTAPDVTAPTPEEIAGGPF